ncbi:hypothetical protein BGP_6204 [Beggiatoa sp. PS]|nr:hypothetical protein BGP_6204 [Beggiatoa sp. PS]
MKTGKQIFSFLSKAHHTVPIPIRKVIYSPNSKTILSAHRQSNKILRLWDVNSGNEIRSFRGNSSETVNNVLFLLMDILF